MYEYIFGNMPDRCRNLKSIKFETKLRKARRDRHNHSKKRWFDPLAPDFFIRLRLLFAKYSIRFCECVVFGGWNTQAFGQSIVSPGRERNT